MIEHPDRMVDNNMYAKGAELRTSLLHVHISNALQQCVNKVTSQGLSVQQAKHEFHNPMHSFCNIFWCLTPARLSTFTITNVPAVYLWRQLVGVPD